MLDLAEIWFVVILMYAELDSDEVFTHLGLGLGLEEEKEKRKKKKENTEVYG